MQNRSLTGVSDDCLHSAYLLETDISAGASMPTENQKSKRSPTANTSGASSPTSKPTPAPPGLNEDIDPLHLP